MPDAVATQALGIDNLGQVVGDDVKADGTTHGYLWTNKRFTAIDGPDRTGASLTEINDRGQILGGLLHPARNPLRVPPPPRSLHHHRHADALPPIPLGINSRGRIVGSTFDALEGATTEGHGFLLRDGADGRFTAIDIPGASAGASLVARGHPGGVDDSTITGEVGDARPAWPEETVPILRVADAGTALRWYERLGFEEEWTHRFEPDFPAFVSIRRGDPGTGVRIFLSEHRGDAEPNGLVYLRVSDIAPVATEFGVEIQDSGARDEVGLVDPDGNRIRVGAPTGRREAGYTYPDASP